MSQKTRASQILEEVSSGSKKMVDQVAKRSKKPMSAADKEKMGKKFDKAKKS